MEEELPPLFWLFWTEGSGMILSFLFLTFLQVLLLVLGSFPFRLRWEGSLVLLGIFLGISLSSSILLVHPVRFSVQRLKWGGFAGLVGLLLFELLYFAFQSTWGLILALVGLYVTVFCLFFPWRQKEWWWNTFRLWILYVFTLPFFLGTAYLLQRIFLYLVQQKGLLWYEFCLYWGGVFFLAGVVVGYLFSEKPEVPWLVPHLA